MNAVLAVQTPVKKDYYPQVRDPIPLPTKTNGSNASKSFTTNSNVVSLKAADKVVQFGRSVASKDANKAAFESYMARMIQEKIEDEKRKRQGGGGGGLREFDRIAVSLMLTNFLSSKTILAMINNFNKDFMKAQDSSKLFNDLTSKSPLFSSLAKLSFSFVSMISVVIGNIGKAVGIQSVPKMVNQLNMQLGALAGAFIGNLKKMKESLEKEIREKLRKLGIKDKLLKVKEAVFDFIVEMKEEVEQTLEMLKSYAKMYANKILRDTI